MTFFNKTPKLYSAIAIILLLVAASVIYWLASPLFRNDVVDETFPFDVPTMIQIETMTPQEAEAAATGKK